MKKNKSNKIQQLIKRIFPALFGATAKNEAQANNENEAARDHSKNETDIEEYKSFYFFDSRNITL